MLMGFALNLDSNEYLFIGIPLTVLFQIVVARAPLRALWVRGAPRTKLREIRWEAWLVVGLFGLANALFLVLDAILGSWEGTIYEIVVLVGLLPMAYALHQLTKKSFRHALGCFATAGTIGICTFAISYLYDVYLSSGTPVSLGYFAGEVIQYIIVYIPALFLLEEVSFRGALDSHVYRLGERRSKTTAVYVSALWGAWHFPQAYAASGGILGNAIILGELVAFQGAVGFFLSIFWRRSGNLFVPGIVHAITDSIRNGLRV